MLEKIKPSFSITTKWIIVAILILIMSIPTFFVESIIWDRQDRQYEVTQEISNTWSSSQTVMWPVLNIHYTVKNKYNTWYSDYIKQILPNDLYIKTDIQTQTRARGIFWVPVYTADIYMTGNFGAINFERIGIDPSTINWDKTKVTLQVDDLRGIWWFDEMKFDNQDINMQNGTNGYLGNIWANVQIPENKKMGFVIHYKLKWSQYIKYISTANTNKFVVNSNRANPSFVGSPLPDTRNVNNKWFDAEWNISRINLPFGEVLDGNYEVRDYGFSNSNNYYNTNWYDYEAKAYTASSEVKGDDYYAEARNISDWASFGIRLVTPYDQYQQTERSVKYGMLFIVLTFVTFFLIEVINRKQIHPFQYILVWLALGLFYLLLLSLSEHIGFGRAYLVSSVMIIGMIWLYIQWFLHENRLSLFITAALSMLYIYIYILMWLEDYALMVWSIWLFIILAVVMYISRKIDRYSINEKTEIK